LIIYIQPLAADAARCGHIGHDASQQSNQTGRRRQSGRCPSVSRSRPWRICLPHGGQAF
jgi:hypothetical protein